LNIFHKTKQLSYINAKYLPSFIVGKHLGKNDVEIFKEIKEEFEKVDEFRTN